MRCHGGENENVLNSELKKRAGSKQRNRSSLCGRVSVLMLSFSRSQREVIIRTPGPRGASFPRSHGGAPWPNAASDNAARNGHSVACVTAHCVLKGVRIIK